MAQPYIIYNGVDSRSLGVWISKLPDIVRPNERITSIQVYGRPGTVHTAEGSNIFDAYEKKVSIIVKPDADVRTILNTFRGGGEVIFSNEPDRIYSARIIKEVKLTRDGPWLMTGDIAFEVQPFKVDVIRPSAVTVASGDTVINLGDVEFYPVISLSGTVQASGVLSVVINGSTFELFPRSAGDYTFRIDCRNETCVQVLTESEQNANDIMAGNYPHFVVGANTVTLNSSVTGFSFVPDWLYL